VHDHDRHVIWPTGCPYQPVVAPAGGAGTYNWAHHELRHPAPRPEPADQDAAAGLGRPALRAAIAERLLVADGAMGSMLQGCPVTVDDFDGHEGLVTVGAKISETTAELFAKNAYRDYLELHGLSVQLAEALAEYWHGRVRQELGIDGDDPAGLDDILKVRYRGCRYAFGYPACPDLEDRAKVMRLLRPERIGVTLSEEFQLAPEQSTDALIAHHPEANYFST
jgi:hypothetical protein